MHAIRLPDLPEFEYFDTIGPNGLGKHNINGQAAAIECYLDLKWKAVQNPRVRWTGYHRESNRYQGELDMKESFASNFYKLRSREENYDFTKLEVLLNHIIQECLLF